MGFLKNWKVLVPLLVVLGGGGYYYKTTAAAKAKGTDKVKGTVYVLPKPFIVNLADGHFANVTVALELAPGQSSGAGGGDTSSTGTSDGLGTLPEEAVVRDAITNVLTGQSSTSLVNGHSRTQLKHEILAAISTQTDVKVTHVLLPDVAVQ